MLEHRQFGVSKGQGKPAEQEETAGPDHPGPQGLKACEVPSEPRH